MIAGQLLFYLFGAVALVSALFVVSLQNLVRSVFLFFVTLFALAGLYVFALADFIAVTQVIIYVGGVLVLMLFAFMLSDKTLLGHIQTVTKSFKLYHLAGLMISACMLFVLTRMILETDMGNLLWLQKAADGNMILPGDNTIHQTGIHMMSGYLLPFEIVSIFLLMALIGAAHLARKGQTK